MDSLLGSFEKLGLNLDTGISPFIPLERIEELSGKRLTGNGSVVRRDNKPWSAFSFDNIKRKGRVVGYQFNGYITEEEQMDRLLSQIKSTRQRAEKEEDKIQLRIKELGSILVKPDAPLFNKKDIVSFL